jgi:hypothetical protein
MDDDTKGMIGMFCFILFIVIICAIWANTPA